MRGRFVLLVVGGLASAAVAVCLVRAEASAYRRSLRASRAARLAASARPEATDRVGPVSPAVAAPGGKAAQAAETPEKAAVVSERPVADAAAPAPEKVAEPATADALKDYVVPDLMTLSVAEEAKLGKLLHMLILANHGADEDSPFERAINAAARPVVAMRERKGVEVTITVLDSDEVNAFSHMGGYIYVTRGLFNLAVSDTDEEFQFVVAHELAHLDGRHAQALVEEAARAGKLAGVGKLQALYHQIAAGYTEAQEFEADDRAIDRLRALDHTTRECLSFLRKLEGLAAQNGFRNGRRAPKTGLAEPVQDVGNHVRSQPAAWERVGRLLSRFKTSPAPAPSPVPGRGSVPGPPKGGASAAPGR